MTTQTLIIVRKVAGEKEWEKVSREELTKRMNSFPDEFRNEAEQVLKDGNTITETTPEGDFITYKMMIEEDNNWYDLDEQDDYGYRDQKNFD